MSPDLFKVGKDTIVNFGSSSSSGLWSLFSMDVVLFQILGFLWKLQLLSELCLWWRGTQYTWSYRLVVVITWLFKFFLKENESAITKNKYLTKNWCWVKARFSPEYISLLRHLVKKRHTHTHTQPHEGWDAPTTVSTQSKRSTSEIQDTVVMIYFILIWHQF
jgi:hypothetical protein